MPSITDLIGPAGPLEALLDEPAAPATHAQGGRRLRPSASAVWRDDAHEGGVSGREGRWRASAAPCCASTSAASAAAPARSTSGTGEKADFTAALDYMAAHYPGPAALGRRGSRSARGSRSRSAPRTIACRALIGIAPPVATSVSGQVYTFEHTLASTKPKFFVQGEADEVCPLEGMWSFYGQLAGAEGAGRHRRRRSPVRGPGARKSARRSRICWTDFDMEPA